MIRINCPICGTRDESEFTYGGDATVRRPAMEEDAPGPWLDYVFMRDNPRGPHREFWHHVQGCRQWLVLDRNTLTHEIGTCFLARDAA
ncbi:sarcosine oxidase subunit delta (plasmid) [Parasedimentitalea marina]|uniref:Sarcosine oxidase subunit delta n=1 Tax=Parasedimentitalea marina TaxID=2483033 RepID=A0A3T0NA81_9RHOB|nr:sarcosine oxidase subunit delta [Parasedimentitalea marina]AZV80923.1 sarcosine oxidase subunit delta [Parasedimentitalea marina]